jgi:hypothetical protein
MNFSVILPLLYFDVANIYRLFALKKNVCNACFSFFIYRGLSAILSSQVKKRIPFLMKFKPVFMLLIGMISFTAMATTPLTDENQTSETLQSPEAMKFAPVEMYDGHIVIEKTYQNVLPQDVQLVVEEFTKPFSAILDVGWQTKSQGVVNLRSLRIYSEVQKNPLICFIKQKVPPLRNA